MVLVEVIGPEGVSWAGKGHTTPFIPGKRGVLQSMELQSQT